MQAQLTRSYRLMAELTAGLLAPVGEAWQLAQQTHPEIELYQGDGRHPAPAGTYLAACVFYLTLFKKDLQGAAPLGMEPARAKLLVQIARQAVYGK